MARASRVAAVALLAASALQSPAVDDSARTMPRRPPLPPVGASLVQLDADHPVGVDHPASSSTAPSSTAAPAPATVPAAPAGGRDGWRSPPSPTGWTCPGASPSCPTAAPWSASATRAGSWPSRPTGRSPRSSSSTRWPGRGRPAGPGRVARLRPGRPGLRLLLDGRRTTGSSASAWAASAEPVLTGIPAASVPQRRPHRLRPRRLPLRGHRRRRPVVPVPGPGLARRARSCASPPTASRRRATRWPATRCTAWGTATCRAWPGTPRAGCSPPSSAPNAADEINLIEPGGNYGWPEVEGTGGGADYIDPLVTYETSEASPSGGGAPAGQCV